MSQLFFFLIERKTTVTAKGNLILPGMDEGLGKNLSSDGQSLLKDRWGLIATGGGGGRGGFGGRGLKCSWGQEWAGNSAGYIRNGTLGPFWLTRKLLGLGVPKPRCWENPQKTLGLGSLQLGSSCGPGIGANHKWCPPALVLTFTPTLMGRRGPPSPTGELWGIRRKLESNCMLKGLGNWVFSLQASQSLGVN